MENTQQPSQIRKSIILSEAINHGLQVEYNERAKKILCAGQYKKEGKWEPIGFVIGNRDISEKDYWNFASAIEVVYNSYASKYGVQPYDLSLITLEAVENGNVPEGAELNSGKAVEMYRNAGGEVYSRYQKMVSDRYIRIIDAVEKNNMGSALARDLKERRDAVMNVLYNGTAWE